MASDVPPPAAGLTDEQIELLVDGIMRAAAICWDEHHIASKSGCEPVLIQRFEAAKSALQATVRAALASATPAPAEPTAHDHEKFDAIALDRYRVVPTKSGFWGYAVQVGDSTAEVYKGHKRDCELVARRMAGAFLDGAFLASQAATPAPAPSVQVVEPAAYRILQRGEPIEATDEFLAEDAKTWVRLGTHPNTAGLFVGMGHAPGVLRPARRPLAQAPAQPAAREQPQQPEDLGVSLRAGLSVPAGASTAIPDAAGEVRIVTPGKSLAANVADALRPYLSIGQKVIWREPFRWFDDYGAMPNHYDGMSLDSLAAEFNYEVIHDCGCAGVIRKVEA